MIPVFPERIYILILPYYYCYEMDKLCEVRRRRDVFQLVQVRSCLSTTPFLDVLLNQNPPPALWSSSLTPSQGVLPSLCRCKYVYLHEVCRNHASMWWGNLNSLTKTARSSSSDMCNMGTGPHTPRQEEDSKALAVEGFLHSVEITGRMLGADSRVKHIKAYISYADTSHTEERSCST